MVVTYFHFSQCNLCALCVSVVNNFRKKLTTETQRTQSCTENFKLGHLQTKTEFFLLRPQRGEMFIARCVFPYFEAPKERNAYAPAAFRSLRSEIFGRVLVAINFSLLWSENKFNSCTSKLNSTSANRWYGVNLRPAIHFAITSSFAV